MSTEVITGNDLKAILNEVLPPTPSEYRKLLWINTQGSQTSYSFTTDFSEYDEIEVEFDRAGDLITKRMGNNGSATFRMLWANYIVERSATISSGTMTFGNGGAYIDYNSSAATAGAAYAVPSSVYGIKYERVLPPAEDALEWKLVGTVTGSNILTLPNIYNELLCYTFDNVSSLTGGFTFHFNAAALTTSPVVYRNGYNFNGASLTNLQMTKSTAQITYYVRDGVDMLGQCSLKVYYR